MEVTFSSAQGGTWGQPLAAWRATGGAALFSIFFSGICEAMDRQTDKLVGGLEHVFFSIYWE